MNDKLRNIPPVHSLQTDERFRRLITRYKIPEKTLTRWLREELQALRTDLAKGGANDEEMSRSRLTETIFTGLEQKIKRFEEKRLRRVINGTGVVLHTNLGRARLGEKTVEQIARTALSFSNLEYDIEKGQRGSRNDLIESLLCEVTGAEAAMVVNNNAAAVFLVLRALAASREVIVSRGELVEIGGSFRVSAIMEESGARLVEVGTTNKTHLYDYEQALTEETAMVMKVHRSNFEMRGFTSSVSSEKLAGFAREHGIICYEDLGSGALWDFSRLGIYDERPVKAVLHEGVDLVSFSGDKLLGGPQAGLIAGKKYWIERLKKHQLARVLRVDKMTLAALESTLKAYIKEEDTLSCIPTLRDIFTPISKLQERAKRLAEDIMKHCRELSCEVLRDTSQVGGGTMPGAQLSTYGVAVKSDRFSAEQLAEMLRQADPPVIARTKNERVFLDVRCMTDAESAEVTAVFQELLSTNRSVSSSDDYEPSP